MRLSFTVIGDVLLAGGVLLLGYIYWPFILTYTPIPAKHVETSYSITIPKINAYAPIIADVDPWDKNSYQEALKKGVGQARRFADFGDQEEVYLFAHSSLPPWEMTRANTSFLRLNELTVGDQILIDKFGQKYRYIVYAKEEVWPSDVEGLISSKKKNQLVLQTCTPVGTDMKRLLVLANPAD